jgi:hypothetical protein
MHRRNGPGLVGLIAMSLFGLAAFGSQEPVQKATTEGAGKIPWAEGYKGLFIEGLDGGLYPAYNPNTIQRVQQALVDRGLYTGPVNGILDLPTMRAIYSFQKATHVLQVSGIPTPRTRKMLEQGSHTDPLPR